MKKNIMPKTVQKWADKHPEIVDEIIIEEDDDSYGNYSIWCYLKGGYTYEDYHSIHEPNSKHFMNAIKDIRSKV